MAGSSATLAIKVIADTKQAQSELSGASTRMGKFQSTMGKLAVPAAIAGAAIIKFGSDAVSAARESEIATARLENVFKSMGDETGRSAKHAEDYAAALSRQIGVDDEVIMAGQAKLATFSKVSSKTAIMAGIFDRATAAGADLAATGFGSIESNAVLLGKALQDPVKGMSALTRVGVTLTDSQKKQVEAFQKSGKTLEAQKIILGAVEKQVKGTAAATATSADKSKVAWGEFMESFGRVLLPIVDAAAKKFGTLADWMNKNVRAVQILVGVFAGLVVAVLAINAAFKVYQAALIAWNAITKVATAAQWLFNAALSANPVALIVLAIVALGVAFIVAYKKSKTFRDFVHKMWAGIKAAVRAVASFFKRAWQTALSAVTGFVRRNKDAFRAVFAVIKTAARVVSVIFRTYWRVAFAAVKTYLQALRAYFVLIFSVVKGVIKAVIAIFKGDWRGAFSAVKDILRAFKQFFLSIFRALPGPVQDIIRRIGSLVSGGFTKLRSAASGLTSVITKPFSSLYDWVQKVIDAVSDLIGWIGKIHVPSIHLPSIPGLGRSLSVPGVSAFSATPGAQPSLARAAPGAGLTAPGARSTAGGPTIVVQGALDPEAVARQIQRILTGHDRRIGRVSA